MFCLFLRLHFWWKIKY